MTDRNVIKTALDNDNHALFEGIKQIFNCRTVDVTEAADVWIADPQRGHWLDDDGRARIARALERGDI